jgi:peroxiredoxin
MPKIKTGLAAPTFTARSVHDGEIDLAGLQGRKVMLSFYRYAACPLCNLRVNQLIRKCREWQSEGLFMLAVFHSSEADIARHVGRQDAPFPIIGDPERRLYQLYGVEGDFTKFLAGVTLQPKKVVQAFSKGYSPFHFEPSTMIPADFLINEDGTIHTAYYGKDASDHIPFDSVEAFLAGR